MKEQSFIIGPDGHFKKTTQEDREPQIERIEVTTREEFENTKAQYLRNGKIVEEGECYVKIELSYLENTTTRLVGPTSPSYIEIILK